MRAWFVWAAVLLTLPAATARAQDAPDTRPVVSIGVEAQRDRIHYHFDNPSSADTPVLVPHFFEQEYVADNMWLVATARYTAGVRWETTAGVAPSRSVRADDFDTFFDPNDIVIVSGTTGGAGMRSFRIAQRADVGRAGPIRVSVGYRFRWDRFDFGVGQKTVTRNSVLIAASEDTSREMTDSQVHDVMVGFRAARRLGGVWRLDVSGEVSPATLARLVVQLPDKYPGQDLVFLAKGAATLARVALVRAGNRWPLEISMQLERTWRYQSTAQLSRSTQGVAVSAGRSW